MPGILRDPFISFHCIEQQRNNSVIAAGLRRYGFEQQAIKIMDGTVNKLYLRRIKLRSSSFDLRFTRTRQGEVGVDVTSRSGSAEVDVQSRAELRAG